MNGYLCGAIFVVFTAFQPVTLSFADSARNATALCAVFDDSELLSAPCQASDRDRTINLQIDMSAAEANQICNDVSMILRENGMQFDAGWKISIVSPDQKIGSTAECGL